MGNKPSKDQTASQRKVASKRDQKQSTTRTPGSRSSIESDSGRGQSQSGRCSPKAPSGAVRMPFDGDYPATSGWNPNWDSPPPGPTGGAATLKIMLIRHGEHDKDTNTLYTEADMTASLNDHGAKQATATGQKLAALVAAGQLTIDEVLVSSMTRAKETAAAILHELAAPNLVAVEDAILREGEPYPYTPRGAAAPLPWDMRSDQIKAAILADYTRFTEAFAKYFKRPANGQSKTVLIVCHANITKFFLCKALQIPLEAYNRLRCDNCAISTVSIDERGTVTMDGMNDTCHLPARPGPAAAVNGAPPPPAPPANGTTATPME